jgi:hypothetical protein
LQATDFGQRVYRMRGWQRTLYLVLGLLLCCVGAFIVFLARQNGHSGPSVAVAIIPLVVGAYLVLLALRSRLIIDRDHIEVQNAFCEQSAELNDIKGFRTLNTRNGSYWRLERKQGGRAIIIQKWFDCDDLRAWFQQLTDLDEVGRNALLDEIRQDQHLGTTPDERLNALKQAKQVNIALSVLTIVMSIVALVYQGPVRLTAALVLALVPVMALYLLRSDPLLYAVGKPKRDPRTDLTIAVFVSGLGLMLVGVAVHFATYKPLLEWGALVAAIYIFAFSGFTQKGPRTPSFLLIMLIYGGMYSFGFVMAADTLLDNSPSTTYATYVVGEHETHGRSTSYYLDLAPWGPFSGTNKLSVSRSEYTRARNGDAVCLALRPGYLRAPWYTRVPCGDHFFIGNAH